MAVILTWEGVEEKGANGAAVVTVERAEVPGGWLVRNVGGTSLAFVPDHSHDWGKPPGEPGYAGPLPPVVQVPSAAKGVTAGQRGSHFHRNHRYPGPMTV